MKKGFVLIEFLIALALAALIMISATSMLLAWHRQTHELSRVALESIAVAHVCSSIMRELSHAPQIRELWKKQDKGEVVWTGPSGRDRGLCIRNGRLVLLEGNYDGGQSRWISSTQSTLADDVRDLVFEYVVKNQLAQRVHCSFYVYTRTRSFDVCCRDHSVIPLAGHA